MFKRLRLASNSSQNFSIGAVFGGIRKITNKEMQQKSMDTGSGIMMVRGDRIIRGAICHSFF